MELAKQMISAGANLERVDHILTHTCLVYGLREVTIASLSTRINISAKDENGEYSSRMALLPAQNFNLERLKKLNDLSRRVREEKPKPEELSSMLGEVKSNDFAWWVILLGYVVAMAALSRLFNAGFPELLIAVMNTVGLFFLSKLFAKAHINKIITNFVSIFLASVSAMLFYKAGFVSNYYIVMITNAFFLIPGIQMVNCARNLLCGHESNGVIELLKILIETCAIVAGVAAAYALLGNFVGRLLLEETLTANEITFVNGLELVVLTLLASAGFGIVFNIQWSDLPLAALGGAVVRVFFLLFQLALPSNRFLYTLFASFAAALYSEIVAAIRKQPTTLCLYPAIVPLIPGDLFYYTALGLVWGNVSLIEGYGVDLALALLGISVGFVICSTAVHYIRKIKISRLFPKHGK